MRVPVPGMTEAQVSEEVRMCFEMAAHTKRECSEAEAKAVFKELLRITQWHRERMQS